MVFLDGRLYRAAECGVFIGVVGGVCSGIYERKCENMNINSLWFDGSLTQLTGDSIKRRILYTYIVSYYNMDNGTDTNNITSQIS